MGGARFQQGPPRWKPKGCGYKQFKENEVDVVAATLGQGTKSRVWNSGFTVEAFSKAWSPCGQNSSSGLLDLRSG